MNALDELKTILNNDYCIGCGLCAVISSNAIHMEFNENGQYAPKLGTGLTDDSLKEILKVCPFSNDGAHEDEIAREHYGANPHNPSLGYFDGIYAGYSNDVQLRSRGSSGGLATWLLAELLRLGEVDGILHVTSDSDTAKSGRLFKYAISKDIESVLEGGKSKYYPVELSEVLSLLSKNPGRYALVGLPCFIKATRRFAAINPELNQSIVHYVGIVCGHLKSKAFAESFAWSNGVHPRDLDGFEFRTKIEGNKASDYGVTIRSSKGEEVKPVKGNIGANWGLGFFKYNACEYCDDVFAETADVVIGDAWLPEYIQDEFGTSLVLTRSAFFKQLLSDGVTRGEISLDVLDEQQAIKTQEAGLRHRRDGLSYRLYLKSKNGEWAPRKRVKARSDHFNWLEKFLHRMRLKIKDASHTAWKKALKRNDWRVFERKMGRWIFLNRVVVRLRMKFKSRK